MEFHLVLQSSLGSGIEMLFFFSTDLIFLLFSNLQTCLHFFISLIRLVSFRASRIPNCNVCAAHRMPLMFIVCTLNRVSNSFKIRSKSAVSSRIASTSSRRSASSDSPSLISSATLSESLLLSSSRISVLISKKESGSSYRSFVTFSSLYSSS